MNDISRTRVFFLQFPLGLLYLCEKKPSACAVIELQAWWDFWPCSDVQPPSEPASPVAPWGYGRGLQASNTMAQTVREKRNPQSMSYTLTTPLPQRAELRCGDPEQDHAEAVWVLGEMGKFHNFLSFLCWFRKKFSFFFPAILQFGERNNWQGEMEDASFFRYIEIYPFSINIEGLVWK